MPAFKKTPAKVEGAKNWGVGKIKQKGKRLMIVPIKRKGVRVGKAKRIK